MAPLTPEGLAKFLQRHIEDTAARFRETDRQLQETDRQLQHLAGQVDALVGLLRDQGLRLTALAEQQAEQQTHIRQILHRLEQHDGRLEQHDLYIRRMLDLLERRGGDGGPAQA